MTAFLLALYIYHLSILAPASFSIDKSANNLMRLLYLMSCFFAAFKLPGLDGLMVMCLGGSLGSSHGSSLNSWICKFMYFRKFVEFLAIISLNILFSF